jgi:hypothetical protein
MNPTLDKLIRHAEAKWLKALYDSCRRQFKMTHLPSHDETHHLRVWENAKFLLHYLAKHVPVSETDIERLIVAVFFHDQGMSETSSKEHGKISRHNCKIFFNVSELTPPPGFEKVLQAIENHDQKNYVNIHKPNEEFDVQVLLNTADDLDALGVIGAYRYLEIYLLRDTNMGLLPATILDNLSIRFRHFSETFSDYPSLIKVQTHRYASARNYFKDLNLQLKLLTYSPDLYLGPIGVVNYIRNEIIGKKHSLLEVCNHAISSKTDFYSQHFFERLKKEMAL